LSTSQRELQISIETNKHTVTVAAVVFDVDDAFVFAELNVVVFDAAIKIKQDILRIIGND
jgi:hypothetical protein